MVRERDVTPKVASERLYLAGLKMRRGRENAGDLRTLGKVETRVDP